MRGPAPIVLTDMKDINSGVSADSTAVGAPKLGQELLHNINLIVDLGQV